MILGLSVVQEITKNFHAAHVQDKQLEQVEWRKGEREQAKNLIEGDGMNLRSCRIVSSSHSKQILCKTLGKKRILLKKALCKAEIRQFLVEILM